MGEIITTEETSTDIETNRQEITEKVAEDDKNKSLGKIFVELNDNTNKKDVNKYLAKKEEHKKIEEREKSETLTSKANDKSELYDPLAGLELYGITYQAKRREKPIEQKTTKQPKVEATHVDVKETEFEENNETVQKDTQFTVHEMKKTTEMLEKSIQTDLRKFSRYKKSNETSHDDIKICKAVDSKERKKKKEEKRRKKWTNKRKHRKIR